MIYATQKIKFSIKDFFNKCEEILRKLRIWPHLLKKSLMENFSFCAVAHALSGNTSLKTTKTKVVTKYFRQIHFYFVQFSRCSTRHHNCQN